MINITKFIDEEKIPSLKYFEVDECWEDFLSKREVQEELIKIAARLNGEDMNPPTLDTALSLLQKDINDINIILVGMDPYPARGVVKNARAFEVQGLTDWNTPFRQNSFKNIIRLLYKNYNNIDDYESIPKFNDIKKLINNNEFLILKPDELFDHWEKQGVLSINRYPTCKVGVPKSHRSIWLKYSDMLFKYMSEQKEDIIWFLWGTEAKTIYKLLEGQGIFYMSNHPMMCSIKNDDDFLKSNCFKNTMNIVNWIN